MIKKTLFVLGMVVLPTGVNCSVQESFSKATTIGTTAVVASALTVSYMNLRHRQTNDHLVDKVNRFWRHVSENVAKVRAEEFSRLILVFKEFDIFVFDLYKKMEYRYCSWTAPWNWSTSMKQAYLQASLLNTMFKYIEIISSWHSQISDVTMCQLAQKVVVGPGIMTKFIDQLNKDIQEVDKVSYSLQCNFSTALKSHLVAIRDMAKSSRVYAQERSAFV